jgi:hypothetical protein
MLSHFKRSPGSLRIEPVSDKRTYQGLFATKIVSCPENWYICNLMSPRFKTLKAGVGSIVLVILAAIFVKAQSQPEPRKVDFCEVVASHTNYYGQILSVEVILWPSEHALTLFGAACVPKEGYDVTTQTILPANWESLPNGKKLRGILKHQRPAKVEVVGIFENAKEQYGLIATRFRFSISQINSVSRYAAKTGGG